MKVPLWVAVVVALALVGAVVVLREFPYWIALPLVVGWLTGQFVASPKPTPRAKQLVTVATVWATTFAAVWPPALIPAVLALGAVGVYLLVYRDISA